MKKFNSLLARFMLVLLALHGLMGAFTLLRMTTFNWKPLSYTLLAIVLLHGILGILLSKDAVREGMRTGRWYLKDAAYTAHAEEIAALFKEKGYAVETRPYDTLMFRSLVHSGRFDLVLLEKRTST